MMRQWLVSSILIANFGILTQALAGQDVLMIAENRGYLGVSIREVTEEDVSRLGLPEERGVYIERVDEDTPAHKGGLLEGDVVLEYEGIQVLSVRQFQRLVSDTPPGRSVEIRINRNGMESQIDVEIGSGMGLLGRKGRLPRPEGRMLEIPDFDFHVEALPNHRFFYSTGLPQGPRLGIQATALTDQMADFLGIPGQKGVLVLEVLEGEPAEKSGLKAGDVVISIDGNAIDGVSDLKSRLCNCELKLELIRRGSTETITVDLTEDAKEKGSKDTPSRI